MSKLSDIGQRVRRRMVDLNITTVKELEQRAGLPTDSIRHLVSGRTNTIRSSKLPKLASALDMSVDELVHGTATRPASAVTMPLSMQDQPRAEVCRLRFDSPALPSFGIADGEPAWLVAQSDNMTPTICAGDVVLIDAAVKKVESDGIYCIAGTGGVMTFRRVQHSAVGGHLSLANDNPKYLPETAIKPAELAIVGKVLGAFRRL